MGALCLVVAVVFVPRLAGAQGLGHIAFPISCGDAARAAFVRGVLDMHSFSYDEARTEFRTVTRAEPGCAMGYWGEAMTYDETLWANQDTPRGRAALAKAVALRPRLAAKEAAFVDAAALLFGADGDGSYRVTRVRAYADALGRMHERWPGDDEIATFRALSLLSASDRATLHDRMQAGAIALDVLSRNPRHPGALHYAIHAFDDPDHAVLALPAARAYAAIAPDAPHARHMPAHIFVELGDWAEAATACDSAWQASVALVARGARQDIDRHSLSWLGPIYLQLGQRARADAALASLGRSIVPDGRGAVVYLMTVLAMVHDTDRWDRLESLLQPVVTVLPAIDARYEAEKSPEAFPEPPAVRATLAMGRAIAASRRHDLAAARRFAAEMKVDQQQAAALAPSFVDAAYKDGDRIDALHVDAEIAAADGRVADAEGALRAALPLEDTEMQSGGAQPGRSSSYERLGELAMAAGRNQEAADDFAHALERVPGRSRALYASAIAAERTGATALAGDRWRALRENWAKADPDFPGVAEARARSAR
jgi:tetratricopeptide (TPR) repeat protein